jgi:ABC-type phosphate transport system substrate-binding protein
MRSAYSVSLSKCQPAPRQALAWLLALGCLIASPLASAEATIKVAGTGSATPLLETLGKAYERKTPRVRVEVVLPPMGSSAAQRAVMGGAIDLALSAKPLAQADQEKGGRASGIGPHAFYPDHPRASPGQRE